MSVGIVSRASIGILAPPAKVWEALTHTEIIRQYMFGADVVSDWEVGAPISFKGVYGGKPYADKGRVLKVEREHRLQYTHFSPLSGKPDLPENYHTVSIELDGQQHGATVVTLEQDNNPTEALAAHTAKNWQGMLGEMKKVLES
jgi:uncharacterized protein YndB with AHSA1/START domain